MADGEEKTILGRKTTFFDIGSTKAKQYGFCMELGSGEKLTCCGDEPYNECEKQYAEHSTWLLHEAFCLHGQAEIFHPYEKHHSTVKDAAELAESLGVKNLLLYHTEDRNIARRRSCTPPRAGSISTAICLCRKTWRSSSCNKTQKGAAA